MEREKTFRFILGYLVGFSLFVLIIPFLLYRLAVWSNPGLPFRLIACETWRLLIGLALLAPGLFFGFWSNLALFMKGKGGPVDAFGLAVSPRSENLVTTGPYRYSRHPMVFGALTAYLGCAVLMNSPACLLVVILFAAAIVVFLKKSEEKRLVRDFGEAYLEYRRKVPMILPFIRLRKK